MSMKTNARKWISNQRNWLWSVTVMILAKKDINYLIWRPRKFLLEVHSMMIFHEGTFIRNEHRQLTECELNGSKPNENLLDIFEDVDLGAKSHELARGSLMGDLG